MLRSSCPGFPAAIMGAVGGNLGAMLLGGVRCVGSGGDAVGGLSVVCGKDAVGERGADVLWGWLLLDWWWNGWGDGW